MFLEDRNVSTVMTPQSSLREEEVLCQHQQFSLFFISSSSVCCSSQISSSQPPSIFSYFSGGIAKAGFENHFSQVKLINGSMEKLEKIQLQFLADVDLQLAELR